MYKYIINKIRRCQAFCINSFPAMCLKNGRPFAIFKKCWVSFLNPTYPALSPPECKTWRYSVPVLCHGTWQINVGFHSRSTQPTHLSHIVGWSLFNPTLSLKFQHRSHFLCCETLHSIQSSWVNSPFTAFGVLFLSSLTSDTINIIGRSFS